MTKKTLTYITVIAGAVSGVVSATLTYFGVTNSVPINASVDIVATAVIAVCTQFVKSE